MKYLLIRNTIQKELVPISYDSYHLHSLHSNCLESIQTDRDEAADGGLSLIDLCGDINISRNFYDEYSVILQTTVLRGKRGTQR
jgi:hypothetical protein